MLRSIIGGPEVVFGTLFVVDDSAGMKLELCGAVMKLLVEVADAEDVESMPDGAGATSTAPQTVALGYVRPKDPFM